MATYYVSTSGNDSTGTGAIGNPWRTIQKGANTAVAGDTVNILGGTYYERVSFPNSGNSSNPITFQGVRGGGGTWTTIIDGTTAESSGWSAVGDGSYTKNLGYTAWIMTSNDRHIFRIGDHVSSGEYNNIFGMGANATANINGLGTVEWWDGVEAFYRSVGGTTRVRFRNSQNPSSMGVRAGASGAVCSINNDDWIVLRDLRVQGGHVGVSITGGANNVTIEDCYVTHGTYAVQIGNCSDVTVRRNELTLDHIGILTFQGGSEQGAGDWTSLDVAGGDAGRVTHRHQYNLDKFIVGDTEVDDARIVMDNSCSDILIEDNWIHHTIAGIVFFGDAFNIDISHNTLEYMSDNAIYINGGTTVGILIHHNFFHDCDHLMRNQSTHQNMQIYVYANLTNQPYYAADGGGGAKHFFFQGPTAFGESGPNPNSDYQVYHNTFTGGGWCTDIGSDGDFITGLEFVEVQNNFMSTTGLTSWDGTGVDWHDNYFDDIWFEDAIPDFILPNGHGALNSAPSLIGSGLPGMDSAYYVDGDPDYGAVQGQTLDEDTEDPTVSMTAPANGAQVVGTTVTVSADADDNEGVVGVQFQLDGSDLGTEDTTPSGLSYSIVWDSTTTTDGLHTLRAIARDAAGNTATATAVTVTVNNLGPAPTITNGHLPIKKRFGRFGRF